MPVVVRGGAAGGIIIEVLSYLFFVRVNLANERIDDYHRELLQTYWFEFLLAASEELTAKKRIACIQKAIYTAIDSWLLQPSKSKALQPEKKEFHRKIKK